MTVAPDRTQSSFYRTSADAEIDLVLELPGMKETWAIEIKHASSAKLSKGFHHAYEDIQLDKTFVVHASEERYPLSENIEAIGLRELVQEFAQLET